MWIDLESADLKQVRVGGRRHGHGQRAQQQRVHERTTLCEYAHAVQDVANGRVLGYAGVLTRECAQMQRFDLGRFRATTIVGAEFAQCSAGLEFANN